MSILRNIRVWGSIPYRHMNVGRHMITDPIANHNITLLVGSQSNMITASILMHMCATDGNSDAMAQ